MKYAKCSQETDLRLVHIWIKFRYCEKATKFEKIAHCFIEITYLVWTLNRKLAKNWIWSFAFLPHVKITQFYDGWNRYLAKIQVAFCCCWLGISNSSMLFAKWYSLICFGHVRFHLWWNSKPKKKCRTIFLSSHLHDESIIVLASSRCVLKFSSTTYIFWLGWTQ